jgi:hypothetical protein
LRAGDKRQWRNWGYHNRRIALSSNLCNLRNLWMRNCLSADFADFADSEGRSSTCPT